MALLLVLFLVQFKQSGRGFECICVYKHAGKFHMLCSKWSWLNLKRLNACRQLQSCLFCRSVQFVGGRDRTRVLWSAAAVTSKPGAGGACCLQYWWLLCFACGHTYAYTCTNASHLHPHLWFSLLLLFELCPNYEDVLQMNNVTAVGCLDLIIYF